jgi:hypothetical protein
MKMTNLVQYIYSNLLSKVLVIVFIMAVSPFEAFGELTSEEIGDLIQQLPDLDTSGAPLNPLQEKILAAMDNLGNRECSLIDWQGGLSGDPDKNKVVKIHDFDRPEDEEKGVHHLMEMSESLSLQWDVQERWKGEHFETPWIRVTGNLSFITQGMVNRLVSQGYLVQMRPMIYWNWNEKMTDVPNWENMYYLPTSCGTLLFTRYKPNCGFTLDEMRNRIYRETKIESFDDTEFNFSGNDIQNNARKTYNNSESLFALVQIYPPTYPVKSIAEEFIMKKHQKYWENVVKTLEGTQSILEIVPFVSSARAFSQSWDTGWWEHKPLVTAADRLGFSAELLLDAIPVLAQARKLRKVSKQMYVYGSVGLLSSAIGSKILIQGELKAEDYARLIVLAIVVRGLRKMPFESQANDAMNALKKINEKKALEDAIENDKVLLKFYGNISSTSGFKESIRKVLNSAFTPFKVSLNLGEKQTFEALVKGFRLDRLPSRAAEEVIYNFKLYRKMMSKFSNYLAKDQVVYAKNQLKAMKKALLDTGKRVKTTRIPEEDFPLQKFLDAPRLAREAADSRIAKLSGEEVTATMRNDIYVEELRGIIRKIGMDPNMKLSLSDTKFNPNIEWPFGEVNLVQYQIPTHFYIKKNGTPTPVYSLLDSPPPNNTLGPNGEEVMLLVHSNIKSVDFNDLLKQIELVTYQRQGEAIQHAMNHAHQIRRISSIRSFEVPREEAILDRVTGTGYPGPISPSPTVLSKDVAPVRLLAQNPETINLYEWIRLLPEREIKEIMAKYNRVPGVNDNALRDHALNIVEMDIFFSYHKAGVITYPKDFNEPLSRILAREYIARECHSLPES